MCVLAQPQIPGVRDKINVFKFERDTLERAGITDHATPTPPFLVVASNDINEDLNAGGAAGSSGRWWREPAWRPLWNRVQREAVGWLRSLVREHRQRGRGGVS